ncbi:MAG TPA: protein kinase family protein, partial [Nocardioides sp.]|nr:protein kinase family protein [Nocardioides sp.]
MPHATRAGDVLAGRYRLVDLLSESGGGRFWRAHDQILERHVALHVISADDPRADLLQEAARRSATVLDQRILRVLDVERIDHQCFVVNEWGSGTSLDIMLASNGPLSPRRGAWLVSEVADSIAIAHAHGVAHGLLSPENVLLDTNGSVRIIGFCVDAALHGMPPGDPH